MGDFRVKVAVGQQNAIKVVSSIAGDIVKGTLSTLSDVNAPTLSNGMVLFYNETTQKWDATLELTPGITQNLDINGGSF